MNTEQIVTTKAYTANSILDAGWIGVGMTFFQTRDKAALDANEYMPEYTGERKAELFEYQIALPHSLFIAFLQNGINWNEILNNNGTVTYLGSEG